MLYAAAPRGIRLQRVIEDRHGNISAVWNEYITTSIFESFRSALADAIASSNEDRWAYEVAMFDDRNELVGHSLLIASCGVVYEPVDDDELDARIEEETVDYE